MTHPTDKISGVLLQKDVEGTVSCSDVVASLDVTNSEKVELTNKGPNTVYFRADGTTATAGASGNGDQLASGENRIVDHADLTTLSFICNSTETATVFYRLYT